MSDRRSDPYLQPIPEHLKKYVYGTFEREPVERFDEAGAAVFVAGAVTVELGRSCGSWYFEIDGFHMMNSNQAEHLHAALGAAITEHKTRRTQP